VLLEIWRDASQLRTHALITGLETAAGLALALLVSGAVAALAVRSPRADSRLRQILSLLERMPLLAFAPLIVVWFGFGFLSAMMVCFLVSLQPFVAYLLAGIESVPREIVEILQAIGATPGSIGLKVYLPACAPFLTRALRVAIPLALAGATVAEFVGSDTGLGYLMFNAGAKADSTELFAALTVLLLMSVGIHFLVRLSERAWIHWPIDASPYCKSVLPHVWEKEAGNRGI
jgi:NitT/TauT family transport system permease protein